MKRLSIALTAGLTALSLAACGGQAEPTTTPQITTAATIARRTLPCAHKNGPPEDGSRVREFGESFQPADMPSPAIAAFSFSLT